MQNNYDFPDHSIHGLPKQHSNRYEYSNQMTSQYYQEMEESSTNEGSGNEDYPNLMKCDNFNNQSHQQQMPHSYGGSRHIVMSGDFYKHENSKVTYQPKNNFYSNPINFHQKKPIFPEMVNENNKKGNENFRNQPPTKQNNWQPIQENSNSQTNSNNTKIQLNRIVTSQSKVDRINVDKNNQMEYPQKQNMQPVSKVQSVVQLMNKFEKSIDTSPPSKNSQNMIGSGNKVNIKQQPLPYLLNYNDDRKESLHEKMENKNTSVGKVANTVKQLQQKLHPHLKNINENENKKKFSTFNNQNTDYSLKINENNDINDILPEPLSSESSELSDDAKRHSIEYDFKKDEQINEKNKRINTKVTSTLSKNMAKEAKMLMEYFQRRRPLLNYLGVGLSDQLWEQVNSLPPKIVRLVYAEDIENNSQNVKQKELPKLLKRLSVRNSIRQDPRKIALKKKLLQSKIDNQNHDSNYSKIDKSLKKQIKEAVTKTLHEPQDNYQIEKEKAMLNRNENNLNFQQQQFNMKYKYNYHKQMDTFENQYEEESSEENNNRFIEHSNKEFYMNLDNIHENHDNFVEEDHDYIEEGKNNFDNSGTFQSLDTKTGRFTKKSAAALIAKRNANVTDSVINTPMKSNSSSSISSKHNIPNIINERNNQEKNIHNAGSYEKEMWNQNVTTPKEYLYNIIEKNVKNTNNSTEQRQYVRSAKSVDQLIFETSNDDGDIFDEDSLPNFDTRNSKTLSYQQLQNNEFENHLDVDELGMPRIPPHRNYIKHPTITKGINDKYENESNYHNNYPNNQFLFTGARPYIPKQGVSSKNVIDYSNNTLREKKKKKIRIISKKGTWRLHGSLGNFFKKRAAIRL
ncbi:Hypothetical protein SRAE_X000068000 [Strongyloides ratti]|uniref:Uncharacterized protein n=1 Tax=Strongyloides ratti TaxID=34506 RepID=A0A090N0V6_STRRB|nr:Hypothetical protein SRAE_X000068000 [Strongyloides ratti]CEF71353.1 Hypothetical protein SRAE_X000068000 [Strongyloides ratti]